MVTSCSFDGATYGDTSPFYGGAEVGFRGSVAGSSVARRCTEGFGWRAPNGLDTMVTAGHCLPVGTNIPYAFTNVNVWGYGVGTAGSTTVNTSGSYPYNGDFRGDVAFINVQSGKESSAYVNTTTNTVARVVGAPHPYAGMPFCLTGITTGRNCSFRITTVRASYSGGQFIKIAPLEISMRSASTVEAGAVVVTGSAAPWIRVSLTIRAFTKFRGRSAAT